MIPAPPAPRRSPWWPNRIDEGGARTNGVALPSRPYGSADRRLRGAGFGRGSLHGPASLDGALSGRLSRHAAFDGSMSVPIVVELLLRLMVRRGIRPAEVTASCHGQTSAKPRSAVEPAVDRSPVHAEQVPSLRCAQVKAIQRRP
jgi:hypothetical protein